jgi:glyoxylase-like metal-dependent hydrolase (beta-lactamase superfamily II)
MHYDHVGNFHRLPNAQFHLQEVELHYTTGRHIRRPFLARSFEVEDVVGIVRLNFAQRVKLYDGTAELSPGIVPPVGGHKPGMQFVPSIRAAAGSCWRPTSRIITSMETGRPFTATFNIGDRLEAYDALRTHAPSPHHVIPGHDPLVMRQYPAPRPELEGVVVRLDVMPRG